MVREGPPGVGASHGLDEVVLDVAVEDCQGRAEGVRDPDSKEW